jgi:hypothetical protein
MLSCATSIFFILKNHLNKTDVFLWSTHYLCANATFTYCFLETVKCAIFRILALLRSAFMPYTLYNLLISTSSAEDHTLKIAPLKQDNCTLAHRQKLHSTSMYPVFLNRVELEFSDVLALCQSVNFFATVFLKPSEYPMSQAKIQDLIQILYFIICSQSFTLY